MFSSVQSLNSNRLFSSLANKFSPVDSSYSSELNLNQTSLVDIELVHLTVPSSKQSIQPYRLRVDPCTAFLGYKNRDVLGVQKKLAKIWNKYFIPRNPIELITIDDLDYSDINYPNLCDHNCSKKVEEEWEDPEEDEEDKLDLTFDQIESTLNYFGKLIVILFYLCCCCFFF